MRPAKTGRCALPRAGSGSGSSGTQRKGSWGLCRYARVGHSSDEIRTTIQEEHIMMRRWRDGSHIG